MSVVCLQHIVGSPSGQKHQLILREVKRVLTVCTLRESLVSGLADTDMF